jgi:2-polyprenyl-6-methoxyphenol hydroxylase-like FAD-dependent oxidoreductase
MAEQRKSDVVVVGAGPVGMFAALSLKTSGVDVRIFDAGRRTTDHSYALVLHGATLDLFEPYGLTALCVAAGRMVTRLGLYEGALRRGEIDLVRRVGAHPHALVLPQSHLESILEGALEKAGVKVQWDHRAQAIDASDDHAHLTIAKLEKVSTGYPIAHTEVVVDRTFQVDASYVVAADGYDSFVRRRLAIPQNDMGKGQLYAVFQFEAKGDVPSEGRLMLQPGRVGGYWPLPSGRCRFAFPIETDAEGRPDKERLRELLVQQAPWFSAAAGTIEWSALGMFERKLVDLFGAGRVWLAGDAAHLTGPLGAQSMNVGLREAGDLARRIARIVQHGESPAVLEEYGRLRAVEWRSLLAPPASPGDLRSLLQPCLPATGEELAAMLAQVSL